MLSFYAPPCTDRVAVSAANSRHRMVILSVFLFCFVQSDLHERSFFENQSRDQDGGTNLHAAYYPYPFAGLYLKDTCIFGVHF